MSVKVLICFEFFLGLRRMTTPCCCNSNSLSERVSASIVSNSSLVLKSVDLYQESTGRQ